MAGSLTIGGSSQGLLSGSKTIGPLTLEGNAIVGEILDVPLKAGDNTILVPEGATAVLVALPTANGVALKIRTNLNAGDAGLPISPVGYMVLTIAAGVTSLIVNAAAPTAAIELSFI